MQGDEAVNLGKVADLSEFWILKNADSSVEGNYLVITETLEQDNCIRRLSLNEDVPIVMKFQNQENGGEADAYECILKQG